MENLQLGEIIGGTAEERDTVKPYSGLQFLIKDAGKAVKLTMWVDGEWIDMKEY